MTITRQNLWKCDFCNKEEAHPDNGVRPTGWRHFTLSEQRGHASLNTTDHFVCCPACGGPGSFYETRSPIRRLLHKLGGLKP